MGSATAPTEDSGIIDLKALTAKAESMRPPAVSEIKEGAAAVEAASAQYAAPLGGYAPVDSEAAPKSRLPLLLGLGAGMVLLLVVGIVIGLKVGSGVAPAPITTGIAPVIPNPAIIATAEPSAGASVSETAEPSASATPEEVATTPKPHRHKGGATHKLPAGGGGAAATPGDGAGASATAATTRAAAGGGGTPAAAPAKKGDCGCKGDLICMMKCSTH